MREKLQSGIFLMRLCASYYTERSVFLTASIYTTINNIADQIYVDAQRNKNANTKLPSVRKMPKIQMYPIHKNRRANRDSLLLFHILVLPCNKPPLL